MSALYLRALRQHSRLRNRDAGDQIRFWFWIIDRRRFAETPVSSLPSRPGRARRQTEPIEECG